MILMYTKSIFSEAKSGAKMAPTLCLAANGFKKQNHTYMIMLIASKSKCRSVFSNQ